MEHKLTADDARQSLTSHIAEKGLNLREKYGPDIGWHELTQILEDREFVRYPCRIEYNAEPLQNGEFAHAVQIGELPEEGFIMYVHPYFAIQPTLVPALVLYQLAAVNYGQFASSEDAESFGSCALGMDREDYYHLLCEAADELDPAHPEAAGHAACM